jgi:hypothetical protein
MTDQVQLIFILTIIFHFKHFLCDFQFQLPYMLVGKCEKSWKFFIPLVHHASFHGVSTGIIACYFDPRLWWLGIVDLLIHFFVDRLKSGPKYFGRFNDPNRGVYWSILGMDQTIHHLTHLYIIYMICIQYYNQ